MNDADFDTLRQTSIACETKKFEWDDRKATANRRKHDVAFEHAHQVFDDPYAIDGSDDDVDEERFTRLGFANGALLVVVYTERGGRIRIISARKARRREQGDYFSQSG